jgi:hypothetical protein
MRFGRVSPNLIHGEKGMRLSSYRRIDGGWMPQVPTLFIRDHILYKTVELTSRSRISVDVLSPPLADRYASRRMRYSAMIARSIFDGLN